MDKYTEKSMKSYNKKALNYKNSFDYKYTKKLKYNFIDFLLKQNIYRKSVLDIACGAGDMLNELYERALITGTGIDIAENMIHEAEKLYGKNLNFINAHAENILVKDDSQDIVTICCAFHHMSNPTKVLSEINRVLHNNGYLYIADFIFPPIINEIFNVLVGPIYNSGDVKLYSKRDLEKFCTNTGFIIEEYNKIDMKSYIAKIRKIKE